MRKEVEFKAKFDTSDFDKSVESMQKKLREIYQPSDMLRMQQATAQRLDNAGFGGTMSKPGSDQMQRSTQMARRELEQSIAREAQGQEKLGKIIAKREESLKKLREEQKKIAGDAEKELEVRKKIAQAEENQFRLRETYKQRDASLNQMLDAKQRGSLSPQRLLTAYQNGGLSGAATAAGRMGMQMGVGGLAGLAGAGVAGIGAGIGMGAEAYRNYTRLPVESAAAMGSATQNSVGRDAQMIYSRRSAFEAPFLQERSRAAQRALEAMNGDRTATAGGLFGNILKWGGAGMGTGAGIGSAIGSVVPGIGTAIGAGVGAAGGGLVGGVTGLLRASPKEFAYGMQSMPIVGGHYKNQYESMVAQQAASDFQGGIESEKNMNPFKKAAVGDYEQNFMRNLQFQRSLGFNNEQMYGQKGFMRGAINNGFTPEMGMEMSGSILGAGGSTRMSRDSGFGLQLQRNADLTNAGQVLGTLSGGMGSSESTKQATIKILAEGMKLGLDDSRFAEENRRFTQTAAEIISKSGATGSGDFERISGKFGSFMGENTNAGIDAAKSAYDRFQQISGTVTGPRGVMRAAGFMKDDKLSQLSIIDRQALMQLEENDLNENNPMVAGMASKLGISTKDLVARVGKVNDGAVSRFAEADKIRDKLKDRGVDVGRTGDQSYMSSLPSQDQQDVSSLMAYQTTEFGRTNQRNMVSFAAGTVGKPGVFGPEAGDEAVNARLNGSSGRMEDNTVAAMAGDAGTVLKNFNEMRGGMDAAAKSAAAFTDQIREMNAAMMKALEDSKNGNGNYADAVKKILKQQADMPKIQTQSGRSSK